MKNISKAILTILLVFVGARASAFADTSPTKVPALYDKLYVPAGFDSNDHVQVVGEGRFKNTCYRHAETTVRVDQKNKIIYLGPVAYEYTGLCIQLILPFERVIDVGILSPGKWEVVQGDKRFKLGEVKIRVATSSNPDDYLYAPISQAYFQKNGTQNEVTLTGDFNSDCLSLSDVKVTIEPDVIVVQPIAQYDNRKNCQSGHFPFSKVVQIGAAPAGRYLLHVRSMNGHAVNSLIDVN